MLVAHIQYLLEYLVSVCQQTNNNEIMGRYRTQPRIRSDSESMSIVKVSNPYTKDIIRKIEVITNKRAMRVLCKGPAVIIMPS